MKENLLEKTQLNIFNDTTSNISILEDKKDISKVDNLPDVWKYLTIDELCSKITDGSHFSPKTIDVGYPYITVRDLDNGGFIDFENCKNISEIDYKELAKNSCNPQNGDILFSKDGTVGKVSLISFDKDFVVLSSLAEQKCIVEKLDLLFEKIDNAIKLLEENIQYTNKLMASVLNDVFEELKANYPIKNLFEVAYIGTKKGYNPEIIENEKFLLFL